MHRKIICASLAVLIAAGFAACGGKEDNIPSTTTSASTQAATTSAPTTTEAMTTTTTAPTTTKPTTTKKVTATRKPTTTVAQTTVATTVEMAFDEYRVEKDTFIEELKYGVRRTRAAKYYYAEQPDGSEALVKEEFDDVYNRLYYSADYDDLLPAAEENRDKYDDFIDEILSIINSYRAEKGVAPLELDGKLTEIAGVRAEEVAWSGKHEHFRPNNRYFSSIFKEGGIDDGNVGENIGWGYATPEAVCQAWKESETHYENLMNPEYTKIGIGVAQDADPSKNYCWVNHFWGE